MNVTERDQPGEPTPSEHGYKAAWKPGDLNVDFWREVLVGRTIKDIVFNEKAMDHLVLDDGQKFFVNNPTHPVGCVWVKD